MDSKIDILFILPSLSRAGAEIQTVNLINGLSTAKYRKHLLCFENDLAILDQLEQDRVVFYHRPRLKKFDLSVIKGISEIIDQKNICLVHCSLQIALLMGWLGIKLAGTKPILILALHTTINRNYKLEVFDWLLYQWLMRSCKKIICVCNNQKNHWERKFPSIKNLTQTIYNGVDVDFFNPENHRLPALKLKEQLGLPDDAIVVAHIAAFRPEKGHRILLEAFKQAVAQNPKAYLVFAGDGALRSEITEQVESMGLNNQVRFLGSIADVRPLLGMSDLSVIASTAVETFSIAMLESMSMGVPLVATDIGGTSEAVIPGVTGFLVPPNNITALSLALLSAINDKKSLKKFGITARQRVIDHFSSQVMVEQANELFLDLVERY